MHGPLNVKHVGQVQLPLVGGGGGGGQGLPPNARGNFWARLFFI
jgi:hypothetical protein